MYTIYPNGIVVKLDCYAFTFKFTPEILSKTIQLIDLVNGDYDNLPSRELKFGVEMERIPLVVISEEFEILRSPTTYYFSISAKHIQIIKKVDERIVEMIATCLSMQERKIDENRPRSKSY